MNRKSSENRKRQKVISVRVTEEEERTIEDKARSCSMTSPGFLRKLGAGFIPRSTLDHQAIALLAKTSGEQGRLGGLLKITVMKLQDLDTAQAAILEIGELIDQIRKSQATLKELVAIAKR